MEYEKLGYAEAIEKLASIYNVSLEYTSSKSELKVDKKILENLKSQNLPKEIYEEEKKRLLYQFKFAL